MHRLLFVCLGNICRSPTAEAAFLSLVRAKGIEHAFILDSAGTGSSHIGEQSHADTRRVAASHGVHLDHRARQVTTADFARFDLLLAMDRKNERDLIRLARSDEDRKKIRLFRSYDAEAVASGDLDVPDPWYTGQFEEVFALCTSVSEALLDALSESAHDR